LYAFSSHRSIQIAEDVAIHRPSLHQPYVPLGIFRFHINDINTVDRRFHRSMVRHYCIRSIHALMDKPASTCPESGSVSPKLSVSIFIGLLVDMGTVWSEQNQAPGLAVHCPDRKVSLIQMNGATRAD